MTASTANVHASANLRAALKYAQAGYPVLLVWPLNAKRQCTCPKGAHCPTPGKHPVEKAWPKHATTDTKRIEAMFARMPAAHIGIQPPEGHVIIDIDPRNGGTSTIKALLGKAKLPATPTQHSGGGGMHLIFKGDPGGPLGKGIDVKRHGRGYVVAWPAGHTSGGAYTWRTPPWEVEAAALPKELHRAKASKPDEPQRTTIPLETISAALAHVNADDYQRWINIGQALRYNYGDEGEAVWQEWSRTSSKWQEGDDAKWETFDHNRDGRPLITVRSIMSVARRSGYRPLAKEFDKSLWALGDISGMLNSEAKPVDWVLEPCVPAGKVTVIAGAGGSSKSYLVLTLAMQLALGDAFGPFKPPRTGKALILAAEEDRDDIHRRLRAIKRARMFSDEQDAVIEEQLGIVSVRGLDWRLVYHDEAGDLHESDRVDYLIDEISSLGDVRLIVLDPLVAFNGANENDNAEMARLMFILDRVADRTGAAIVVLHHVSKGGQVVSLNDATQAVVRGASALVDNARSCLLLTRMPRNDAPLYNLTEEQAGRFVVVRSMKNNYGPPIADTILAIEAGGALRLATEVQRVHATPAAAKRASESQRTPVNVLRALIARPNASQRELCLAAGVSQTRINNILTELLHEGYVERVGVGTRGTHYQVTRSGRKLALEEEVEDLV